LKKISLIGIGGTNGAGKDTVAKILVDNFGWYFVSVTDILRDELKRQGLPPERENTRALSTRWRKQYGLGVLIDKAVEIYKPIAGDYSGLVVASLRNPGEVDEVHQLGGKVVWVDAEPKTRYQRIYSRARGAEDNKSFEQFLREEQDEMEHSGDHNSLSMSAVKAKADVFIENNKDEDHLRTELSGFLSL